MVSPTYAQSQQYSSPPLSSSIDSAKAQSLLLGFVDFFSCQLSGMPAQSNVECLGQEQSTQAQPQVGGLLGFVTGTIPMFYTAPVETHEYTSYLASNFGIANSAYAQSDTEGFTALSPVMKLWLKSRDLAFLIIVIFFILIGFGIMVRFKIDPRTVMTIQNQLPKIVISLILITFSYAIAGLMVDAMWVTTYVGINTLGDAMGQNGQCTAGIATKNIMNNPLNYASDLLNSASQKKCPPSDDNIGPFDGLRDVSGSVSSLVSQNATQLVRSILGINEEGGCDFGDAFLHPGTCASKGIKAGVAWLLGILLHAIIWLIILIALIVALFRVWVMLIKAYVYVILYTILAPLYIMLGLLPNSSYGFGRWFKTITGKLTTFPAIALLFMAARLFIDNSVKFASPQTGAAADAVHPFIPPLIGNPNLIGSGNLGPLIAFGIIMLAPEMLNILQDAFKTQPFKYTPAIMGGFGAGAGFVGGVAGGALSNVMKRDQQGNPVGTGAFITDRGKTIAGRAIGNVPGLRTIRELRNRARARTP